MAFMEPDVYKGAFYAVDADHGSTTYLPVEIIGKADTNGQLANFVEGTIDHPDDAVTLVSGWFCRLSAPGYMDCTEWSGPFDNEDEARAYLQEWYGLDEDPNDDGDQHDED